jgi:spore coat polysaccharide biosynthesis protein SpsF (cytidylyltransferase family)
MQSERLPGKIMADIAGKPLLWHVVDRVHQASLVDLVVVATCQGTPALDGVLTYYGHPMNVLDRYYRVASEVDAQTIVRVTGDCPMIDPVIIDLALDRYNTAYRHNRGIDYVSNVAPPTYPDGLDCEVFSRRALWMAWHKAKRNSEREHVTPYIREHQKCANVAHSVDLSHLRWCVDEQRDLDFVRAVYERLVPDYGYEFGMDAVLDLLRREPELMEINAGIVRNAGYIKSLKEDRIDTNLH